MNISQLTDREFVERLAGAGLLLNAGPFVFSIQTEIRQIADGLRLLYGEFPFASSEDFADFHILFSQTRTWRGGLRPHVIAEIDGHRPAAAVPLEQVFAVFEGCLNWCIYTQAYQYLIIHAAALERGGKAVVLPAPPGSGKSTLCAALVHHGWRLLTDELTLIDTESATVVPIARPISLKNESIDLIRKFAPDAVIGPMSPNTIKGTIAHIKPPSESVARVHEDCGPAWLVVPNYRPGASAAARELPKGEAFMRVAESAVNYMPLGKLGFDLVSTLIDGAGCHRFEYSDLGQAVQWFDALSVSGKPDQ